MPSTLKVRVPYIYECEVRRPPKRKYNTERFGSFAEIEIPCLTDTEAPVAVVRSEGWEDEERDVVETRWFDGAFWEMARRNRGGVSTDTLHEISTSNPLIGDDWRGRLAVDFGNGGALENPEEMLHHPWSNTHDSALSELLERAQGLIVVEGAAWRQVAEPVLLIEQHFSFGGDTVRILAGDAPEGPRQDVDRNYQNFYFRADRADEAAAFADVLSRLFSPSDGRWYSKVSMKALMPETLSWKDEANDLTIGAGFILNNSKPSEDWPQQKEEDWALLREAWTRHRDELSDTSSDQLMNALEDFMDHASDQKSYEANLFHAMCRRYEIARGTFETTSDTSERRL